MSDEATEATFPECQDTPAFAITPAATSGADAPAPRRGRRVEAPPSLFGGPHLAQRSERLGQIRDHVAARCGVSVAEIQSHSRHQHVVWVRMVVCYLGRELTGATWAEIARFAGRDHASIMNAHRRVVESMQVYPHVAAEVTDLRTEIEGILR